MSTREELEASTSLLPPMFDPAIRMNVRLNRAKGGTLISLLLVQYKEKSCGAVPGFLRSGGNKTVKMPTKESHAGAETLCKRVMHA
jgi:hypothetical protein